MRKILFLSLLFACSNKEKIETPPSPTVVEDKSQWTPYEGMIKTEYGEATIELLLDEAEPGLTSPFQINGKLDDKSIGFGMLMGQYSTLSGAAGNEVILQLRAKIMVGLPAPGPRKGVAAFKPDVRDIEIFFITSGGNKLILVDDDFDRIANDDRYTLYRRSRLFTAEGYVTFEDEHTEFFEQNTRGNWLVAPLAKYSQVQHIYDSLVTGKSEGMYLKALAYSIDSDSLYNEPRKNYITRGVGKEFLVVKEILEMKKSEAYTNKERAASLGYQ